MGASCTSTDRTRTSSPDGSARSSSPAPIEPDQSVPVATVPVDKFSIAGQPKTYVKVAQSGNRRAQVFCPDCGTALWGTAPENPTAVAIRLGCIEQRAQLKPGFQVWQHSEAPWLGELHDVPGSPQQ